MSDKYVAFIDPHRTTVKAAEISPADVKKKLKEFYKFSGHASTFHGIFGADKTKSCYNATLFRFPLRQHGNQSKISTNINTVEHIKETHFRSFICEAPFILLFLKSVIKISIYDMDIADNVPKLIYSVEVDDCYKRMLQSEKVQCQEIATQQILKSHSKSFIQLYSTTISTQKGENGSDKFHWLVLNVIGSADEDINSMSKDLSILHGLV